MLVGHERTPWTVKFHPRSRRILASGSLDQTVRVWDIEKAECIAQHQFMFVVSCISFHPNGNLLAVTSGKRISVWRWFKQPEAQSISVAEAEEEEEEEEEGEVVRMEVESSERRGGEPRDSSPCWREVLRRASQPDRPSSRGSASFIESLAQEEQQLGAAAAGSGSSPSGAFGSGSGVAGAPGASSSGTSARQSAIAAMAAWAPAIPQVFPSIGGLLGVGAGTAPNPNLAGASSSPSGAVPSVLASRQLRAAALGLPSPRAAPPPPLAEEDVAVVLEGDHPQVSLYKILFRFKALVVGVNHPFIAPPTCKAYPIAILLHDHWAIYALLPTPFCMP